MEQGKSYILVVEDSAMQAAVLQDLLEGAGYLVRVAENGHEAISVVEHAQPDLVITDVMMPIMDGCTLCKILKSAKTTSHIPVILLTILDDVKDMLRGIECGAVNFMVKPYDDARLLELVRATLEASKKDGNSKKIVYQGQEYAIDTTSGAVLDMFISAYDVAVQKNREFIEARRQLRLLNSQLERKVAERTEALRAEEEERQHIERQLLLSQKTEAIGRLASGVAHDFNNILAAIKGFCWIMSREVDENTRPGHATSEIMKATDRAADLIKQLLAFSKQQPMQHQVVNVNDLVEDMHLMLARLLGEEVQFEMRLCPTLVHVLADAGQIQQVLLNLCVNARDAMLPQGGKISVVTENIFVNRPDISVSGTCAVLSVHDTGHGMDEQTCERIFEPFFSTKHDCGGTGLGLSTVHGIIKQSKGDIIVSSTIGEGTTFSVFLPEVRDNVAKSETQQDINGLVGGTETILVVDDNEMVRETTVLMLETAGYEVFEAASMKEAMSVIEGTPKKIHLLLSDVVMPGGSGFELAAQTRKLRPDMHVLYMSGAPDRAHTNEFGLSPHDAVLYKPFRPAELTGRIRQILDGHQLLAHSSPFSVVANKSRPNEKV